MKEFINDKFNIRIENGILFIEWKISHYEVEDVELGIKKRFELSEGKSYPVLSDFRTVKSGSREARQRLSEKDAGEGIIAVAVIIKSNVQKVLYNFFNKIYKDPSPTKLFTKYEDAIEWLQQYKTQ